METVKLLRDAIVVDIHMDLLWDVAHKHREGRRNVLREDYLDSFRAGGVTCIVSSLYSDGPREEEFLQQAMEQVAALYDELEGSSDFVQALSAQDILAAKKSGKIAIMLAFEGVEPLCGNPDMLRAFHAMGVRMVGLCWARSNWAADGSKFFDHDYVGYGITEGGRQLLSIARELRMLVDVSHLNEKGFWELEALWDGPIIASHSCTRALSDTPRNLSDAQIVAIGRSGGVIGINGASLIADIEHQSTANMDTLVAHMSREKLLAGAGCLGLGLDQCDRLMDSVADGLKSRDILPSHAMLPDFVAALAKGGFEAEEIVGALGGNFLRALQSMESLR